jgi:hypothetical protein
LRTADLTLGLTRQFGSTCRPQVVLFPGSAAECPCQQWFARQSRWHRVVVFGGRAVREQAEESGEEAPVVKTENAQAGGFNWSHRDPFGRRTRRRLTWAEL